MLRGENYGRIRMFLVWVFLESGSVNLLEVTEDPVVEGSDTDSESESDSEGYGEGGAWRWQPFFSIEVEKEGDEELEALRLFPLQPIVAEEV